MVEFMYREFKLNKLTKEFLSTKKLDLEKQCKT